MADVPALGWWGTSAITSVYDASGNSSADIQAVAASFFKDMEQRQIQTVTTMATYANETFSGNGRLGGGFWQINEAKLVACPMKGTQVLPGDVSGQWTMAGTLTLLPATLPFRITNHLKLNPVYGLILTRVHFKVDGAIQAVGDTSNLGSIVFTAVNPELGWGHIEFDSILTSNPTSVFKHCIFEYGSAPPAVPFTSLYNCGGALAIRNYNNIIIENCLFHHNRALFDAYYPASGGAIALRNSSPVISQCEFINNNSKYGGGIMCYDNSNPEINRNLFYNNSAMNDGGVLEIWNNCNPYVENNTFVLNSAMSNGGAVDIYDANPQFINNIFRENSGNTGNQISVTSNDCNVDFEYNDIEGGEAGICPYGIGNGVYENNIDADPDVCGCPCTELPFELWFTLHRHRRPDDF